MANPLSSFLSPALDLLGQNFKILPAVGGAVEDLQHPDREELDDTLLTRGEEAIEAFAETPEPAPDNLYRHTPSLFRNENHFFQFFIDGCISSYYLGTAIEGRRSFPIELAQIGAAVIKRQKDGTLKTFKNKRKLLLLLPRGGGGLSDTLWIKLQRQSPNQEIFKVVDIKEEDILSRQERGKDPRDVAGGKARWEMHELEISLISSIYENQNQKIWTILDGGLRIGNVPKTYPLIGVAKSFAKNPEFFLGTGRKPKRVDITTLLAGLPFSSRTVAFSMKGGNIAFWYVRLREQKELDYPLMGVVKVEVWRKDKKPISSGMADLISRALVAERNVTPYGIDRRWHCHLYPIHMTEQAIRSNFFSRQVLMGCIKWPRPQTGGSNE